MTLNAGLSIKAFVQSVYSLYSVSYVWFQLKVMTVIEVLVGTGVIKYKFISKYGSNKDFINEICLWNN